MILRALATVFPHHSVYLLSDLNGFLNCKLSKATIVPNSTQGGGQGFEFALEKWEQPYYLDP
ncbi:hypothetical protein Pint_34466 [Pistacia integerrima]|uniref:Uncharacterized protein n=1 Tax=Pistacia integerrima TaxID=434235 RepID=A0ACC0X306_9ROSI|nr:hypothetical protein Pint_34466 [Pistacia integerrima]